MVDRLFLTGVLTFACAVAAVPTRSETPTKNETAKPALAKMPAKGLTREHPRPARFDGLQAIDIPQWAKDAGHNGRAVYRVTAGADGRITAITLHDSSRSAAIDEAALKSIQSAAFRHATDREGNPVAAVLYIFRPFSRWDDGSPGGGLDTYRCADLTREYDWFGKAFHNLGSPTFALEDFYVRLNVRADKEKGGRRDPAAVSKQIGKSRAQWLGIVKACRKEPDTPLLDKIDDAAGFRALVESR